MRKSPVSSTSSLANHVFRRLAAHTARGVGSPWAFASALLIVFGWGVTGPLFHYSDTWQLVINTGTTIVTFLMVFLIQNTQNRDSQALHLKLDELIRANVDARNRLIGLDELSDEELAMLQTEFLELARKRLGESRSNALSARKALASAITRRGDATRRGAK